MTFDRAARIRGIGTIAAMKAPRSETVFRIGSLIACLIVTLPEVTRPLTADITETLRRAGVQDLSRVHMPAVRVLFATIPALTAAIFGWALWLNTSTTAIERRRRAIVLLVVQTVIAALSFTDYFFIVAAQIPFVLAPVSALIWLAIQLLGVVGLVTGAAMSGADVSIPEMAGAPRGMALGVSLIYVSGWQIFAFAVGYVASSERRARLELHQRSRELLATQQMLTDSSRIAERTQISRELHDTIGHSLTVLNVNLEFASHLTEGQAAEAVTKAQTVTRMLLADVREIVHSLGDDRAIDLRGALRTLVADSHSPAIHLSIPDDLHIDDPSKAHVVFRCIQEAITNAVRHARARNLWIQLTQSPDALNVRVADDGEGRSAVQHGHGLKGMRARLEEAGGSLNVQTTPGHGFAIDASIPMLREQP
jgi:signal transduction histidine kinase